MNNEALNHAYDLFSNDGYSGSIEDFSNLLSTNEDAVNHTYSLFQNDGYTNTIDEFKNLVKPPKDWRSTAAKLKEGREKDEKLVYEYRTEGDRSAWGKSTDSGKTFEMVEGGNIPEEWFEDPKFMEIYKKETEGFAGEDDESEVGAWQNFKNNLSS